VLRRQVILLVLRQMIWVCKLLHPCLQHLAIIKDNQVGRRASLTMHTTSYRMLKLEGQELGWRKTPRITNKTFSTRRLPQQARTLLQQAFAVWEAQEAQCAGIAPPSVNHNHKPDRGQTMWEGEAEERDKQEDIGVAWTAVQA
jgi:hypothetical protein